MKLNTILPGKLYQRGDFHRFAAEDKVKVLREHNIGTVVCLWGKPDADLLGSVVYRHAPIPDGKLTVAAMLEELAKEVAGTLDESAALAHCHAGRNRSGLFNALVVREYLGLSGSEALAYVREARPRAVDNLDFEDYLRSLPAP